MAAGAEFHNLSESLAVWHRFDPAVKVDLFSTLLGTASGVFLIDATPIDPAVLQHFEAEKLLAGLVVTNSNHARSTLELAERLGLPVFAHAQTALELAGTNVTTLQDGTQIAAELAAITIEGAAPGEIALHCSAEGGTLIFGDALINLEGHGFTLLPRKYCKDQKLMRKSLRKTLDYTFQRILFAHGNPIISEAQPRLAELLGRAL